MNWTQFKDPVSHVCVCVCVCVCLAGAVVASWSLTQEVAGGRFEPFYFNDKYFLSWNSVKTIKKTQLEHKLCLFRSCQRKRLALLYGKPHSAFHWATRNGDIRIFPKCFH